MSHSHARQWLPPAHPRGFTLIELLCALAVVGILSALTLPRYGTIIQRAQRNDARLALLQLQHLQERHYAAHLHYASALGVAADEDTLIGSSRSVSGHYLLSLSRSEDGQSYTATARARPDGRQRRDRDCQLFSVDETGHQRSAGADGRWSDTDSGRCWGMM